MPDPKRLDEAPAPAHDTYPGQSSRPSQKSLEPVAAFVISEGLRKWGVRLRGRNAYMRDYMKDKRAADKLGISVKEYRAQQKDSSL